MEKRNSYTSKSGFTLVELLIVIVVIAILAAITLISYNGIQKRAFNVKSFSQMTQWKKNFQVYHAQTGEYPQLTSDTNVCLGTGFPKGPDAKPRCRNYDMTDNHYSYLESDNTDLMAAFADVIGDKSNIGVSYSGGYLAGPYVVYEYTGPGATNPEPYKIVQVFKGKGSSDCPDTTSFEYAKGDALMCSIRVT